MSDLIFFDIWKQLHFIGSEIGGISMGSIQRTRTMEGRKQENRWQGDRQSEVECPLCRLQISDLIQLLLKLTFFYLKIGDDKSWSFNDIAYVKDKHKVRSQPLLMAWWITQANWHSNILWLLWLNISIYSKCLHKTCYFLKLVNFG